MSNRKWVSVAATVLVAGLALLSLPTSAAEPAGSFAAIGMRMQAFIDQGEIAGAVTVVGRHDAILNVTAVGSSDLEKHRQMTQDAIFRIASMTKPITAIGIMMLVDEGKMSVDDLVEKHLPEFRGQMLVSARDKAAGTESLKKPARSIKVRDLLTHTAGIPDGPPGLADLSTKQKRTLADGILIMSQRPLDFEPGSKWSYSNQGINTLGRIIEVVSGQRYEDFLQARVFGPLGMTDTTFYPTPAQLDRLAVTYGKKDGRLVPPAAPISIPNYPGPAGGLFSTAADLSKLYQMMLNRGTHGQPRLLSEKAIATMTTLQTGELKTGFVPGMGWGFGWGVVREPKGITEALSPGSFGHGGVWGTQVWIDPTKDLFTVLLIQRSGLPNSDGTEMRHELQNLAAAAATK
jgi:CubicO group peptidase (beta-lactamase class C family)